MSKYMFRGASRSGARRRRPVPPWKRLYRGMGVESLEDRLAPAVQVFSGLEFLTAGGFSVTNNVVTSSSPVQVGAAPASGAAFTPLLLLQSGVEFNSADSTGTFTTPPSGGVGGAVSGYAGGAAVALLDAHAHTFQAPALLGSSYDVLPTTDVNSTSLGVAGGDLAVAALRLGPAQLDVQGNLSLPNFAGLALAVGGSNDVVLSNTGVALSGLSVTLPGPTSFTEAGLSFTATNLQVTYSSTNNQFALSGSATLAAASNTLDLTLGTMSAPGLVIQNGALDTLDATVTSNITLGGQEFTTQELTIKATAGANVTVTGAVSFALNVAGTMETVDLILGSTGTGGEPGLVIDQSTGALVSFDAMVNSNITIAGFQITTNGLAIAYQSTGQDFEVSGAASFALAGSTVGVTLGDGTASAPGGLVITSGQLTSLDATLNSNIAVAGLTIMTTGLTVDYSATSDSLDVGGTASFSLAGSTVNIKLGNGNAADPGLALQNGQVESLDATLNSNIAVAGLTIMTTGLTVDYSAMNDSLDVSGMASFSLADSTVSITLGNGTATDPGLVLQNGQVENLNATISSNITIAGLVITTNKLGIQYTSASLGSSLVISGTAGFMLAGSSVSITLGDDTATNPGGIVIVGGQLMSLDASVTGNVGLLGINLQASDLTFEYMAASGGVPAEFALYGGVSLSSSFLDFSTTLGTQQSPGIVVQGGVLESLNIDVSGGFTLFGLEVQANGLTINYDASSSELELAGGIMLDFTSVFEVSAAISQGGLFINTSTGVLSVPASGLMITASATLGPFSIQNLMISFSEGPGGVNFSASGMIDLPGGFSVSLTQLVIQNGQLVDIGLAETGQIAIGDTGFFLDGLSGSLDNLNNISQLVVSASATISFGETVTVPSLAPLFAGGTFALIQATGSITVSASQLDLSGSVSVVGGLLGQGTASLDLNWATGVYMVSGNFSMFDDIFSFGGDLTITSAGDITLLAMASVNIPPQIPFVGGDSLGSINFFLQYEPNQSLSQDVAAAWTTVDLFAFSFTIGFEVNFNGNVSIINGNDVAAFTAAATPPNEPSIYQDTFSVPSQTAAGAVPTGAQIDVSSPILDGAYPVTPEIATASGTFIQTGKYYYATYVLPQSNVILSSLSFTVAIETDIIPGGITVGTVSFSPQGKFQFQPMGNPGYVPTGATLSSSGALQLEWTGAPVNSYETSITASYDVADASFELLQQSSGGATTPLAVYSIDPVTNSPTDPVQPAAAADLTVTANDVVGQVLVGENGPETQYVLQSGQAVPQTVSFSLYQGQTLLGNAYFDSSGNLQFVPNGTPPIEPISGRFGIQADGEGLMTLTWPTSPGSTAINIQYATVSNRVIDFPLSISGGSSSSGGPEQYIIELVSNTPLPSTEQPMFSTTTLYQAPTVSFAAGSVAVSQTGVLSGTLLANAYTPNARIGNNTTVSLYYSSTGGTKSDQSSGQLIATYDLSAFTSTSATNAPSYSFSWPGFANLAAGSYDIHAVINDGQNPPVASPAAGPFTEASPTPVLSAPNFFALMPSNGAEQAVFSAASLTLLGVTTNFITPVTVTLSATNGDLLLGTAPPTPQIYATYPSAAAALAALNGLVYESNNTFTGAAALTYAVSTTENGLSYSASDTIPLLTPNTPLVVSQTVDSTIPSSPDQFNLTLTVANPGGPDGQNGTNVQVQDQLSPGLSVVSSSATEGSFNPADGLWTVGDLPTTGANSATLNLVLEAAPSTQGQSLTSSAEASSALFVYPALNADSVTAILRPLPITITVTNLNDGGAGSLPAAIAAAENGDTIQFSPSLAGTLVLTSGQLLIDQNLTIVGPTNATGGPAIAISGNQASRVLDVEGGKAGINVVLRNLTIENGAANANSPNAASAGGGLLINDAGGTIALTNVLINNNSAQGNMTAPAQGGGVAFLGGTGMFTHDTFSNNQAMAAVGGGSSGGGLALTAGNVTLISDTVANNAANGGQGGGISASGGFLTLSNATIADNNAPQGGDVSQTAPAFVESVNSILASASTTATAPDFSGTVAYSDHNLIDNTAGSTGFSAVSGDLLNVAADLAPLGNYGGPLQTMPPLPGSPAVNAGDSGALTAETIPNLVAFWQGDGNANDATGANNATLTGGATYGPGAGGTTGFVLNGSTGFVQTAANPASLSINNVISVSAIVNPTALTYDSVIIDKTEGATQVDYRFGLFNNGTLYFWNGSQAVFSTGSVPLNTFSQVGFTLTGGDQLSFYINGQLDSTQTIGFGVLNTGPVLIGHDPNGGYFQGTIQDLAVYNSLLTPAQMNLLASPSTAAQTGGPTGVPGLVSLIGVQGTARDLVGASIASATPGVTYGPGVIGQAFLFNGTSGAVTVAGGSTLDPPAFTIGGWFNAAAAPASGTVVELAGKSDGAGRGWTLTLDSALAPIFTPASPDNVPVSATSSQSLMLNTWYYIAATFDGTNAVLYIDGAAVATTYLPTGYATTSQPLMLGASSSPIGDYFAGAIDDFAFFDVALTGAQIRPLSLAGSAAPQLATVSGLADFYAGQGNALDSAGNNNGTLVGGVGYAPGLAGQAFSFSGQGSYIALGAGPDIVGTGAFAVAAWVKTTSTGTEVILNQRDPNNFNGDYSLYLANGQVNFNVFGNSQYEFNMATTQTVNDGQWHLIVAQRLADGTGQIYIDGALDASQAGAPVPLASGVNVYIGEDVRDAVDVGPGYSFNYVGEIEGVQIDNFALTAGQIATLQNSLGTQIAATTDQRGLPRRVGGGLDVGAVEYQYDLTLTGGGPSSVPANDLVDYTLTATNSGPDSVAGATLTDTLPQGVVFESVASPPGWFGFTPAVGQGGQITLVNVATFAPGDSAQFTVVGLVTSAALNSSTIVNTAAAGPSIANATAVASTLTLVTQVPNGLGLLSQPTSAFIRRPISPALVFNVVDNSNNTVVTDNTQLVTLAIASGPAGATLSGTTTVRAVDGVAKFTNVSVNMAGTYVLVAVGGDLTPIDTNPIDVAPVVIGRGIAIRREPLHDLRLIRRGRARTEIVRERIVIENTSRHALKGPIGVQVDGLAPGETLANASGMNDGAPYRDIVIRGNSLAPHQERVVTLDFTISGKRERGLQRIYNNIELFLGL